MWIVGERYGQMDSLIKGQVGLKRHRERGPASGRVGGPAKSGLKEIIAEMLVRQSCCGSHSRKEAAPAGLLGGTYFGKNRSQKSGHAKSHLLDVVGAFLKSRFKQGDDLAWNLGDSASTASRGRCRPTIARHFV